MPTERLWPEYGFIIPLCGHEELEPKFNIPWSGARVGVGSQSGDHFTGCVRGDMGLNQSSLVGLSREQGVEGMRHGQWSQGHQKREERERMETNVASFHFCTSW